MKCPAARPVCSCLIVASCKSGNGTDMVTKAFTISMNEGYLVLVEREHDNIAFADVAAVDWDLSRPKRFRMYDPLVHVQRAFIVKVVQTAMMQQSV